MHSPVPIERRTGTALTNTALLKCELLPMDERTLVEIVSSCPLGWINGKLIWCSGTSEADVIEWIKTLREKVGLPPQFSAEPKP